MSDLPKIDLRDQCSDWPDEPETCTVFEHLISWIFIPLLALLSVTTIAVIAGVAGYLWDLF